MAIRVNKIIVSIKDNEDIKCINKKWTKLIKESDVSTVIISYSKKN